MEIVMIAVLVFGICFCLDKLFQKLFRSQTQHHSGTAVRLNKRYATVGILLAILGIIAIFAEGIVLAVGGGVLLITGICLVVYYLSFGIYYDGRGFLYCRFGRRSVSYPYKDIKAQLLYNNAGNILIELHMQDGKTVALPSSMAGVYDFMDTAFAGWLHQTGRKPEECTFYDPENSCWFPPAEA